MKCLQSAYKPGGSDLQGLNGYNQQGGSEG